MKSNNEPEKMTIEKPKKGDQNSSETSCKWKNCN